MSETTLAAIAKHKRPFIAGEVALVGAGPGDPDLLTIQALRFIQQADIVVYDRLVSDAVMALLPEQCERIYVGKKQADHRVPQQRINEILVEQAQQQKKVVRLKGGDPFVFGRGSEEALFLLEHQIPCHIVPGITAASACTSYAAIPLTHRELALSCTFITGHTQQGDLNLPWQALANSQQTVVFYMGVTNLPIIVKELIAAGRRADTPAAVIRKGTQPEQQVVKGTLATLVEQVAELQIKPPSLIVVGEVVAVFKPNQLADLGYLSAT
jgi:uroporphyrin-III C-methyltransferase